jgi:bacteriocin-like protein
MSNESLPQPQNELSDEELTQVSGGHDNTVQPNAAQQLTANTPAGTQAAIEKVEIAVEKIERVLR